MLQRVSVKLFLVLITANALVAAVALLLGEQSVGRGFRQYLEQKQMERLGELARGLEEVYARHGSWDFLRTDHREWRRLLAGDGGSRAGTAADEPGAGGPPYPWDAPAPRRPRWPPPPGPWGPPGNWGNGQDGAPYPDRWPPPPPRPTGGEGSALWLRGVTLFDLEGRPLIGPAHTMDGLLRLAVGHSGETVGWVASPPLPPPSSEAELEFLHGQRRDYLLIGLLTLALAGLGALLLARRLLRPVRTITQGAHRLAGGHLDTRIPVHGGDEIARLAGDFNHLAETLEANESARRRWIADISHELRTPLAVLRGEVESLQDGVRAADTAALASLHGEVLRLSKLVDDLYQLALSDLGALTYRKGPCDPLELLEDAVEGFRARFAEAGLTLDLAAETGGAELDADPQRLGQLFHNLLENSLRYTDRGGQLRIALGRRGRELTLDFQDSAPGVPAADLPRLFERLYRADASRSRARGGAGLGLAICRNIAQAHQGRIEARPSPLGGVWIAVRLPLAGP
jgi:two-component system, OmpR family, sensor histidine kinase BaeS